jgi:hypothetical protein
MALGNYLIIRLRWSETCRADRVSEKSKNRRCLMKKKTPGQAWQARFQLMACARPIFLFFSRWSAPESVPKYRVAPGELKAKRAHGTQGGESAAGRLLGEITLNSSEKLLLLAITGASSHPGLCSSSLKCSQVPVAAANLGAIPSGKSLILFFSFSAEISNNFRSRLRDFTRGGSE